MVILLFNPNLQAGQGLRLLHFRSKLTVTAVLLLITLAFDLPAVFAAECKFFNNRKNSEIFLNRGKWSPSPQDKIIDLAGEWQFDSRGIGADSTISVPFAWNDCDRTIKLFRYFRIPEKLRNRHFKLVVDGACQSITIAINNVNIDTRRSTDAAFQVNLNPGLFHFGETSNVIKIVLNNHTERINSPPVRGSIYEREYYGGITRGIYLTASPPAHISEVLTKWSNIEWQENNNTDEFPEVSKAILAVDVEFTYAASDLISSSKLPENYFFRISLKNPVDSLIFQSDSLRVSFSGSKVQRKILRIPVDHPVTSKIRQQSRPYTTTVELFVSNGLYTRSSKSFIPAVRFYKNQFEINGKPTQLKCISYYFSDPEYGPIPLPRKIEKDVQLIKNLGADVIRIQQGSASRAFLEACENHGLYVLEELPVFQVPDRILRNRQFVSAAIDQAVELVSNHRRYSCIIGWGIGSEINSENSSNSIYYQSLVEAIRTRDDRPVYASIPLNQQLTQNYIDFLIGEVTPYQTFSFTELDDLFIGSQKLPVLVGGIRRLIKPGNANGWEDPTSEAAQAYYTIGILEALKNYTWLKGVIVGDFADWKGSVPSISGPLMGRSALYTSGLVTPDGRTRLAYRHLREYWQNETRIPLSQGNYQQETGALLLVFGLVLVFIFLYTTRQNNIFRFNIARSIASPRGFFQDISDFRYFQSSHTLILAVLISGGFGLVGAGWCYAHRFSYNVDWITGFLFESPLLIKWISTMFWQPLRAFLFWWLLIFILIWVGTIQSATISSYYRRQVSIAQNFDYIVWASIIMLGTIPLGLVSTRLYLSGHSWIVHICMLGMILWSYLRLLWVYQLYINRTILQVVLVWLIFPVFLIIMLYIGLEYFRSISYYINFILNTIIR